MHLVHSPRNLRVLWDNLSNDDRYARVTFPRLIARREVRAAFHPMSKRRA